MRCPPDHRPDDHRAAPAQRERQQRQRRGGDHLAARGMLVCRSPIANPRMRGGNQTNMALPTGRRAGAQRDPCARPAPPSTAAAPGRAPPAASPPPRPAALPPAAGARRNRSTACPAAADASSTPTLMAPSSTPNSARLSVHSACSKRRQRRQALMDVGRADLRDHGNAQHRPGGSVKSAARDPA